MLSPAVPSVESKRTNRREKRRWIHPACDGRWLYIVFSIATENNKVGGEERAKELNLPYPCCLSPCSLCYWVSHPHFHSKTKTPGPLWSPLHEWGSRSHSFIFLKVCLQKSRVYVQTSAGCVCICMYITCCDTGGIQCGTKRVWRHLSPWGSGLRYCVRRSGEVGTWTDKQRERKCRTEWHCWARQRENQVKTSTIIFC